MLIAQEKKRTNLAEYILYMWQIEDIIRAYHFDSNALYQHVIAQYNQPKDKLKEIRDWYENLIEMMRVEHVEEKGHIQIIKNSITELNDFHLNLLHKKKDAKYASLYQVAIGNIAEFRRKSNAETNTSDIEMCLTALYGILLLKLKKQEISKDTLAAVTTFSNLIAYLATSYKDFEKEDK